MLQLSFQKFQEKLVENRMIRPTLHYLEKDNSFTLLFKAREKWEYYTVVLKTDIVEFSRGYGVAEGQELSSFFINFLSGATPIMNDVEAPRIVEGELLRPSQVVKQEENEEPKVIETEPIGNPQTIQAVEEEPKKESKVEGDPIEPGDEMVKESVEYGMWFEKVIDGWEKKILSALNKLEVNKSFTVGMEKTFGEFMSEMMNAINSVPFLRVLRKIIKKNMVVGLESAEVELDVNIGFGDEAQRKLNILEDQQLNGYSINGKKWHGIKGASKETQTNILRVVQEGVRENKSVKEITSDVKKVFSGSTNATAKRIARTESTRFVAEGRLGAYKDSGVDGRKAYAAVMDKRTADICRRLHNKYFKKGIPYDEPFIDDVTNKAFQIPPAHVNCRCTPEYRLPLKE